MPTCNYDTLRANGARRAWFFLKNLYGLRPALLDIQKFIEQCGLPKFLMDDGLKSLKSVFFHANMSQLLGVVFQFKSVHYGREQMLTYLSFTVSKIISIRHDYTILS